MGNKIDIPRVETNINNLAENKSDIDKSAEFKSIFEAIDGTYTQEFKDILNKNIKEMKEEYLLNLIDNTVKYVETNQESSTSLKFSVELLSLLIDCVYHRYGNLRNLLVLSISFLNFTHDVDRIRDIFPFNVLSLSINLYSNENFFQNKDVFKNHIDIFEVANSLSKIIYNIIYYQKNNQTIAQHCVEHLDVFKLYFSSDAIDNEVVYKFMVGLFLNVFINFKNLTDDILDPNIPKKLLESYIVHNFYLLLWFCVDVNKFFFVEDDGEYNFENEFNQAVYTLSKNILHKNKSLSVVVKSSNKFYSDSLKNILLYNTHIVRNFILTFFNNEDTLTVNFRNSAKMILIYFFELNQVII
jgi:hypothetical protein